MVGKYIFFDFETSGKGKKANPKAFKETNDWEQILQVGAVVADDKLNQTNQTMNKVCRLRTSVIPQPGALLTTKKTIKEIITPELSSYELVQLINKQFLDWKQEFSNSVFIGHNSIEFDENLLEYSLFTNLLNPYITRPNRGDTLNLARGLYAVNPSAIKVGTTKKGNPMFKLPVLAELNNLPVESAHDALSDVRSTIALAKFIFDNDPDTWKQLEFTMNADQAIDFINKKKGFTCVSFFSKVKVEALSMVCESRYKKWYHTINLEHDPDPLLKANLEEFKKLIKKKNRYVICTRNPILFSGKIANNYEPYSTIGSDVLNQRAEKIFKNKFLAEKFKHMEIDRQLEKEEEASQDNIFPETKASDFINFTPSEKVIFQQFHQQTSWDEKYKVALQLKNPKASFIAKRLIFDESPETLSEDDFQSVHRELHDRLVINQDRPFTTIPESMNYVDTELSKIEESDDDNSEAKIKMLNDFNMYLIFMEKYFSNKNSQPLKKGTELVKQIFG